MIKKRTVLVLGAGSNVPYGFSAGGKLLRRARLLSPDELAVRTFQEPGKCGPLHNAIAQTIMSSIDAMLKHRPELWPALKMLMAFLLLREEAAALGRASRFNEDWLALVVEHMAEGADTIDKFAENPVSFVTFNYDRSLEYRLAQGLAEHYGISETDVWKALVAIPIVHVHGSFGLLPEQRSSDKQQLVAFGAFLDDNLSMSKAVLAAENSIKIVHEASETDEGFASAKRFFQAAQQVLFLGFSFAPENIRHLCTSAIPKGVEVYCTTWGMEQAEVNDRLLPAFPNQGSGSPHLHYDYKKIRQYLRENVISVFR